MSSTRRLLLAFSTRRAHGRCRRQRNAGNSRGGARQRRLRLQRDGHQRLPTRCRHAYGRRGVQPRKSGFVHSGGGFRCTDDVGQGPLLGCLAGEGVRWDTVDLRRSTSFKCTGAALEPLKTVTTDENTVGLDADFYRAGDGNDESFTAQMIVSDDDLAPDITGIQNVWIQGVGCASAIANFSS